MLELTPLLRIVTLASCNPVGTIDFFPILYDWLGDYCFLACTSRRKGRGSIVQHCDRVTLYDTVSEKGFIQGIQNGFRLTGALMLCVAAIVTEAFS